LLLLEVYLVLSDTQSGEVELEGSWLKGEDTTVVDGADWLPELLVERGDQTLIGAQAMWLSDTPWVTKDDIFLVSNLGTSQDGVGVVGNNVAATVVWASGVSPCDHWVHGTHVQAVLTNNAIELLWVS